MIGCSSNNVPFNKKTNITYTDNGVEYKMAVQADSIRGGIEIKIENLGIEEICLEGESAIYEDAHGNSLQAVNEFFTRPSGMRSLTNWHALQALSGRGNFAGITPPQDAAVLVFKNFDRNKTYFRVSLK
jgi:hypothetical protein